MITIHVWLVFGIALPSNASQTVTMIPYASLERCEREMDRVIRECEHIKIKPYCTSVMPSWWVRPNGTM